MKEHYIVYEIFDNDYEDNEEYQTPCVGVFNDKEKAATLCDLIDLITCNGTRVEFAILTKTDIVDLWAFGLKGTDCYEEIIAEEKELGNDTLSSSDQSIQDGTPIENE